MLGLHCCVAFLELRQARATLPQCLGFSSQWLLLWSTGSRVLGFITCGVWAQWQWLVDSRVQA